MKTFVEYVIGALKDIQSSIDRSNELFEKRENRIMAAIDDLTAQVNRAIANGARAIAAVSAELAAVKQALIDAAAGSPSQSALLEDLATDSALRRTRSATFRSRLTSVSTATC